MNKQAILFLSDKSLEPFIQQFNKLAKDAEGYSDSFYLYHQKYEELPAAVSELNHFVFKNDILSELGYRSIEETLVPGSNHFPLLKFYLQNPQYEYYWNIEDDVRFSGSWAILLDHYSEIDTDFITCHIQSFFENTGWYWWRFLKSHEAIIPFENRIKSFNPIYRISNRALALLHQSLIEGWAGHHEVVMPTLFHSNGLSIADFGGEGRFVPEGQQNKFYTNESMTHLPIVLGKELNRLYHPIKVSEIPTEH